MGKSSADLLNMLAVLQPATTYLIRRVTHCFQIPSVWSRGYYPGEGHIMHLSTTHIDLPSEGLLLPE